MTIPVSVMPISRQPSIHSFAIAEIIRLGSQKDRDEVDKIAGRTPGQFEWLGNLVLPPFQRPSVWTQEQKVRFIDSIWRGYDIGRYMVVHWEDGGIWADCLIDGQQRIRAILEYTSDSFPMIGVDDQPYFWSSLSRPEQRRFENVVFPRAVLRMPDLTEEELRDIYNRCNYGGTAHTEDQRA